MLLIYHSLQSCSQTHPSVGCLVVHFIFPSSSTRAYTPHTARTVCWLCSNTAHNRVPSARLAAALPLHTTGIKRANTLLPYCYIPPELSFMYSFFYLIRLHVSVPSTSPVLVTDYTDFPPHSNTANHPFIPTSRQALYRNLQTTFPTNLRPKVEPRLAQNTSLASRKRTIQYLSRYHHSQSKRNLTLFFAALVCLRYHRSPPTQPHPIKTDRPAIRVYNP